MNTETTLYHASPAANRASILAHGLLTGMTALTLDDECCGAGVYLAQSLDDATGYVSYVHTHVDPALEMDIWRVRLTTDEIADCEGDGMWFFSRETILISREPIAANRIRLED